MLRKILAHGGIPFMVYKTQQGFFLSADKKDVGFHFLGKISLLLDQSSYLDWIGKDL